MFTDWYGQQSCTAGRAAFITGQSPIRTGLTKVGLPGSPLGLKKEDPTIAELPAISGDLLSAVISTHYIFGFRKDNPNVFNNLIQNWPHF